MQAKFPEVKEEPGKLSLFIKKQTNETETCLYWGEVKCLNLSYEAANFHDISVPYIGKHKAYEYEQVLNFSLKRFLTVICVIMT